jgi:hypothetical protein
VNCDFSQGTPVSSTNKIDKHNIIEILLKMALNTINHKPQTIICNDVKKTKTRIE